MQKVTIPASALLQSILIADDKDVKVSCELSTLVENEDYSHITVDCSLDLKAVILTLSSQVALTDDNGLTVCAGIDQNTENTTLHIQCGENICFEYGGEIYEPQELAELNEFHSEVLNTKIANLDMVTVDHLLKQIMPCYAMAS